jgi:hypothetical protein
LPAESDEAMPEIFSFTWELFDKVSESAKHIQEAMEKAEHAMKHSEGAAKTGIASWSMMGIKMGAVSGVVSSLTTSMLEMGKGAVGLAARGADWALEALSFNENVTFALEGVLGTKKAAQEAIAGFRELRAPFASEQVIRWGKALREANESQEDALTIMKAAADLGTLGTSPEEQKMLTAAVVETVIGIEQMGTASERSIKSFKQLGLNVQDIEKNMAATLTGGNVFLLRDQMEKGVIPAWREVQAILQTIQDKFGGKPLGSRAALAMGTMSGLITQLKGRPSDFLVGLEHSSGFKALKKVLENLLAVLDPKTTQGKALMGSLKMLSDQFAVFLEPLTGEKGKTKMLEFFTAMVEGIGKVLPVLGKMVDLTVKVVEIYGRKTTTQLLSEQLANPETALSTPASESARERERRSWIISGAASPLDLTNRGYRGAERLTVTVQNTNHFHGPVTDTDALAAKLQDIDHETFTMALERFASMGFGG